jgi:hypothetical protein
MSNKHNLLYKTWAAGLRRWRRRRRRRKRRGKEGRKKRKENTRKVDMYILPKQTWAVTCYNTDLSSRRENAP